MLGQVMGSDKSPRHWGFTLVELLIVIAVVAIVLTLAMPSFREMIEMQRLRSINAQVVTDVQFARSEAASRQRKVFMTFKSSASPSMTCYVIHTCANDSGCTCNCAAAEGSRCTGTNVEVRTAQIPTSTGVKVTLTPAGATLPSYISFDPATGGMLALTSNPLGPPTRLLDPVWIDSSLVRSGPPTLRTVVATTGRPSVCSPAGSVPGVPAC